jgi:flagellar biosynthesis/type III secretory pathway protein FliH
MASVLKSRQFSAGLNTAQAEVFNFEDVASRAKLYIDSVREQAAKMVAIANEEANQIRADANSKGLAAGEGELDRLANERAEKLAEQRVKDATTQFQTIANQLNTSTNDWLRQWQHETIPLAIAIAEKLVARQLELDSTILMDWISESVQMVHDARQLQLRIHPETAERLGDSLDLFLATLGTTNPVQIKLDQTIERHGVRLDSESGSLDLQLTKQLERLEKELQ